MLRGQGERLANAFGVPGHVQSHHQGRRAGASSCPQEARDAILCLQPSGTSDEKTKTLCQEQEMFQYSTASLDAVSCAVPMNSVRRTYAPGRETLFSPAEPRCNARRDHARRAAQKRDGTVATITTTVYCCGFLFFALHLCDSHPHLRPFFFRGPTWPPRRDKRDIVDSFDTESPFPSKPTRPLAAT